MIDALATEPHFLDHIAPVWQALPEPGTLWVSADIEARARALGLARTRPVDDLPLAATPTLTASYGDAKRARRELRPVILMEHGTGQSYAECERVTGSYVGAEDRDGVVLVLVPNGTAKALHDAAHPSVPSVVIGSPYLDHLAGSEGAYRTGPCVSFHWDCHVCPETRSAWGEYAKHLHHVVSAYPRAIGHAHPRLWPRAQHKLNQQGLRSVQDFSDVCRWASVYCVDNSSTLFLFAALDRPVVVINSKHYRRDVHHGGRFWDWADVGVQCNDPAELVDAIDLALADPADVAERRREIVTQVFPHRGQAASRAVAAIEQEVAACGTTGPRR